MIVEVASSDSIKAVHMTDLKLEERGLVKW